MSSLRDKPEFIRGEEFERALSAYLQRKGWGVLPVYDYSGADDKAPAMHLKDGGLVLPDLFAARAGVTFWCEAKRKRHADYTYKTGQYDTGFPRRLYHQYQAVKQQSGIDVWLFFGHEEEDEVRCAELDEHEPRFTYDGKMSPGGMAFFPWDALRRLCALSDLLDERQAA